jgi:hypothetical protein
MRAAAVVACLGCLAGAARAQGAVEVTVEPPTVARVEFDRRDPPADMPAGLAEGGAWCHSSFELEADVASSIELLSATTVRAQPAEFDLTARLKITIYTPRNSPHELRAHEEGHRAIAEYYYGKAEAAAREAAASVQSRFFEADGADRAAAEQAVAALILDALKDEFMRRTHARSAAANARYDALTRHGLEALAATEAVAAALAQDP